MLGLYVYLQLNFKGDGSGVYNVIQLTIVSEGMVVDRRHGIEALTAFDFYHHSRTPSHINWIINDFILLKNKEKRYTSIFFLFIKFGILAIEMRQLDVP